MGMKLFEIICILLILGGTCLAEDLIFFADDHYKSLGILDLKASVTNPALNPGNSLLKIDLANTGRLEELIPINDNGSPDDVRGELKEEMHSVDALNINAVLDGTESLRVTSGPQHISVLRAGDISPLQFNITAENSSRGWFELPLHLDYMRQVDVSVSNGTVSPLYQSFNQSLNLRIFVTGDKVPLRIIGIKSELLRGKSGTISVVIENDGAETHGKLLCQAFGRTSFSCGRPGYLIRRPRARQNGSGHLHRSRGCKRQPAGLSIGMPDSIRRKPYGTRPSSGPDRIR